jgi:uncharacterized iron-regulated protein
MVLMLQQKSIKVQWLILCVFFSFLCSVSCQKHVVLPPATELEQELMLSQKERQNLHQFKKKDFPRNEDVFNEVYIILQNIREKNLLGELRYLSENEIINLCGSFDIRRYGDLGYSLKDPNLAKVTVVHWITIEKGIFKGVSQGAAVLNSKEIIDELSRNQQKH